MAITIERGFAPKLCARETAMGTIRAVVAVLDMKFVRVQPTIKMTNSRIMGLGFSPRAPTMVSAIKLQAPVVYNALDSSSETPKSRTTFKSID